MSLTPNNNEKSSKMKCGRPRVLNYAVIKTIIHSHRESVMSRENALITPKTHKIWQEILDSLPQDAGIPKNAKGLYSFVANNVGGIRDEIRDALEIKVNRSPDVTFDQSSGNWEDTVSQDEMTDFQFKLTESEFRQIIDTRIERKRAKDKTVETSIYIFKKKVWLPIINKKIWYASGRKCGYNNINSYISRNGDSGKFKAHCTCGSILDCAFETEGEQVVFKCIATEGDGRCRSLFLREPQRSELGEKLLNQGADLLQTQLASEFKHPSHNKRAPMVPNQNVLRSAKAQFKMSQYYAVDPITALTVMKKGDYYGDIHGIGMDPTFVHYWTPNQRNVYCRYQSKTKGTLFADATGGFTQKFTKVNGEKTHALFLYVGVVNCSAGQFSVAQMISEAHDTITITHFWLRWMQYGFPKPPEVVTDSGRALVTSIVVAFTKYKTIESYADAGLTEEASDCYIRYDVAHFLKMYAGVLKNAPRLVKTFYMACLGKLVKMTNKGEIRDILRDIFILGLFETSGNIKGKTEKSLGQRVKDRLFGIIKGEPDFIDDEDDEENEEASNKNHTQTQINDYTLSETDPIENTWFKWASTIKEEVLKREKGSKGTKMEDNGSEVNGYRFPSLIDRLIIDIRHIPLWTGVTYHKYNYGRLPASSASVECEIRKIKNGIFKRGKTRPDEIVKRHLDYLHGRTIIVETEMDNLDYGTEDTRCEGVGEDAKGGEAGSTFTNLSTTNDEEFLEDFGEQAKDKTTIFDDQSKAMETSIPRENPDICFESADNTSHVRSADPRTHSSFHMDDDLDPSKHPSKKTKISSRENNSSGAKSCVACIAGYMPSAHHCIRCKQKVHLLDGCSVAIPGAEEGHGQARICVTCDLLPTADTHEFISQQLFENWRGQGVKYEKKSRGLYTGGNEHKIKDILSLEKSCGLPILKNGGSLELQPVRVGGRLATFIHTCPFDSLYQLLLAASSDYPSVPTRMEETPDNKFYELIIHSIKNPVHAKTYRLRGEILIDLYGHSQPTEGIEEIDCKDDVRNFVKKVFRSMPSWTEYLRCKTCQNEREVSIEVISLPAEALKDKRFSFVFQEWIFSADERQCNKIRCQGIEEITKNVIGNINST